MVATVVHGRERSVIASAYLFVVGVSLSISNFAFEANYFNPDFEI